MNVVGLNLRNYKNDRQMQQWWSSIYLMIRFFWKVFTLNIIAFSLHMIFVEIKKLSNFSKKKKKRQRDLHEYFLRQIFHASEKWIVDDFMDSFHWS